MGAYILRRLLLIIPTLLGIMIINFTLTQFVPGGPIEQILAQMEGQGDVFEGISGGGSEVIESQAGEGADASGYVGARGLPKDFIEELEREFGLDKPPLEQFLHMMGRYFRFDFGESYFRSVGVLDLVWEKMPVSITLGLWSTVIAYLVSIPLGIRKAVRDGSSFDTWTSGLIIVAYAIPGFLFAILLLVLFAGGSFWQMFPLRGLTSDNFEDLTLIGKVLDYLWHITLPVVASTISAFATLTLTDEEQVSGRDPEAICGDRAGQGAGREPGALRSCVPQRDADRDCRVPGSLHRDFLWRVADHRDDLLAGRAWSAGVRGGSGARLSGDLRHAVLLRPDRACGRDLLSDLMYVLVDPRIDFETREG